MGGYNLDQVREQQRRMLSSRMSPQAEAPEPPPPVAPPAPAAPQPAAAPAPPASGYDRNALSQAFQAKQFSNDYTIDLPSFLSGLGGIAQGVTAQGSDKIRLPNGEVVDVIQNVDPSGRGRAWWGSEQDWQADEAAGKHAPAPGGGGATSGAMGAGAPGSDFQNQIRALLMQQLGTLSRPVDANDPLIAGEMQAQERTLERNRQDRRAAAAERMAFTGLNSGGAGSGAFEAENNAGFEDKGQALSGIQAQLFSRATEQKRAQLNQLLNLAMQSGDAESARALQLQIANMDAELRRMGLSQQASQWNDQYGLQREGLLANLNQNATNQYTGV